MPRRTDSQSGSENGRGAIPPGLAADHPLHKWIAPILRLPLQDEIDADAVERAAEAIFRCSIKSDELDLPKSRYARTAKAARQEAERFFKLAWSLWQHMESMHKDARDAISNASLAPGLANISQATLEEFEAAAARMSMAAFAALQDFPEARPPTTQPTKAYAAAVADKCAELFLSLTGTMPTVIVDFSTHKAQGPFVDFLDDVFRAYQISASPEAMGRAAIAKLKEQKRCAAMEEKAKKPPE